MRLLLDTHALVWWFAGDPRLGARPRAAIDAPTSSVYVSAATAYEITFKHGRGKLPEVGRWVAEFEQAIRQAAFQQLDITLDHALAAGRLALTHGDPFDRLLIAQAQVESLTLVSNERLFDETGVARLW